MKAATVKERAIARELGYRLITAVASGRGDIFARGKRVVWPVKEGWVSANLLGKDNYVDQETHATLEEALRS